MVSLVALEKRKYNEKEFTQIKLFEKCFQYL